MIRNQNWDVCPDWVRFSSARREKSRRVAILKDGQRDDDVKTYKCPVEVTGEAIPLPNGNHIHKICTRSDIFGRQEEVKTGPAISIGRGQHIHLVRRKPD